VVTKADLVPTPAQGAVVARVRELLARTSLGAAPVLVASSVSGEGLDDVRAGLSAFATPPGGGSSPSPGASGRDARLAIDRVFAVRGRGTVVTGTLRGGPVAPGTVLRLLPDGADVRVREVQVRGGTVDAAAGGRTALSLAASRRPPCGGVMSWPRIPTWWRARGAVALAPPRCGSRRAAAARRLTGSAAAPPRTARSGAGGPRAARVHRAARWDGHALLR